MDAEEMATIIAKEFQVPNETGGQVLTRWQNADSAAQKIINQLKED